MAVEVINNFDKYEAICTVEAIAYQLQGNFVALGYPAILFLVDFDELSKQGWWGCYTEGTDTITIDINLYMYGSREDLEDTIAHELCHLYIAHFHREAVYAHGREFIELIRKVGYDYDNSRHLRNHQADKLTPSSLTPTLL